MATDYGWFQSQRITSRNNRSPQTAMGVTNSAGRKTDKRRRSQRQHGSRSNVRANFRRGGLMVDPFDLKTALLAKHAQHVVLIHFSIALFITAVAFDLIAHWTKRSGLADTAYYNLLAAAISTLPVIGTGIVAWQFQLDGKKLKGILLLHLVLACVSSGMIWLVWWVNFRARRRRAEALPKYRLAIEFLGVGLIALTGHLGGFLSGINTPG